MSQPSKLPAFALALLLTACGAGEPQNEAVVASALPGGFLTTPQSSEARQYLADGVRELDFNRIPEAFANFEQAVAAEPGLILAHLLASSVAPRPEVAIAHLAHAEALVPRASEYEKLMVEAAAQTSRGNRSAGVRVAQQLTQSFGENPRSWWLLAWAQQSAGQYAESRQSLHRAIEVAPDFTGAYMLLAESYTQAEPVDYAQAEQLLQKVIELEPRESYVHDLLGDAYRAQGRLEEAAAQYTLAAELDPTSGGPLQQRAHVNTFLGRYAEARADYDAGISLEKGNARAGYAAYRPLVHVFEGNPQGAIQEYERLFTAIDGMDVPDPDGMKMGAMYWQLGIAYHTGALDVAERTTKRIREIRESRMARLHDEALRKDERRAIILDEGWLAAYRGRFADAERSAAEAQRMREQETAPNKDWAVNELRGTIALRQGRYAEAVEYLVKVDPSVMYPVYQRAVALEKLGRTAEARALYQRITTYYFNDPGVAVVRQEAAAKARG